jgi:hypothetical protein
MCGCMGLRGITGVGVGAKSLWETGYLIFSMGLVWREVRILAQRSTTPSKEFLSFITTHVMQFIYCKYAVLRCSYFCPLQVKNKPHDGETCIYPWA